MVNEQKLAIVTVWYNPNYEVIDNISSYGACVDKIYCIDNSDTLNEQFVKDNRIEYIPLRKNTGIAHALNLGCKKAIEDGNDIIITFDQDTLCDANSVENLARQVIIENGYTIVAPRIKYIYRNKKRILSEEIMLTDIEKNPAWVITSGSAFKCNTYLRVNGFDEKLFISQVDQDFCFRVINNEGKITRLEDTYVWQEPGRTIVKKILGRSIHIPNLNAKRYYYIFRNEIYLRKKWGYDYKKYKVKLYKYIISILAFENSKFEKICSCIKGVMDVRKM